MPVDKTSCQVRSLRAGIFLACSQSVLLAFFGKDRKRRIYFTKANPNKRLFAGYQVRCVGCGCEDNITFVVMIGIQCVHLSKIDGFLVSILDKVVSHASQ